MDTVAAVLAALAALQPAPGGTTESRRTAVEGIVAAATEKPLWPVPANGADPSKEILATSLVLAAIAQHESAFDPRVGDCRVRGGGAITYFQLLGQWALDGHEQAEVCGSPAIAAQLALRVLQVHRRRCRNCAPTAWLAGYASGSPGRPSQASRDTVKLVEKLARAAHLQLTMHADRAPTWERGFVPDAKLQTPHVLPVSMVHVPLGHEGAFGLQR